MGSKSDIPKNPLFVEAYKERTINSHTSLLFCIFWMEQTCFKEWIHQWYSNTVVLYHSIHPVKAEVHKKHTTKSHTAAAFDVVVSYCLLVVYMICQGWTN